MGINWLCYRGLIQKYPQLFESIHISGSSKSTLIPKIFRYIPQNDIEVIKQHLTIVKQLLTKEELYHFYFEGFFEDCVYQESVIGLFDICMDNGLVDIILLMIDFYPCWKDIEIFNHGLYMEFPSKELQLASKLLNTDICCQSQVKVYRQIWYLILDKFDRHPTISFPRPEDISFFPSHLG